MNLTEPLLLLVIAFAVIGAASFVFRGKHGATSAVFLAVGVVISLIAGLGVSLRQVTEGPFAYVDHLMWVMCAAIFSQLLLDNGTFDFMFSKITAKPKNPTALTMSMILFIAIPGMLTGTVMAGVLITGAFVGKYLLSKGMERSKVVELVSVGALIGLLMPPISVPQIATIIARRGLYTSSFEGYFLSMLIISVPALLVYAYTSGKRLFENVQIEPTKSQGSALCQLPLIVVAVLVLAHNFLYAFIPFLGYPLIFTIGIILALVCKAKSYNIMNVCEKAISAVAGELALLLAMASLMSSFRHTGVSGTSATYLLVSGLYALTPVLFLIASALIIAGGKFIGTPFAYAITGFAIYACGEYGSTLLALFGMGACLAVTFLITKKNGLPTLVAQSLEVENVDEKLVLKGAMPTVAVTVIIAAIFMVLDTSLNFLML